ncbi:MAG: hypothetical protein RID07_20750, partial [Lacipirellulaceae bacterium]
EYKMSESLGELQNLPTNLNPFWAIHFQQFYSATTRGCKPNDLVILDRKMLAPMVNPWIEQVNFLFGLGIERREIRAFIPITMRASPCQIRFAIFRLVNLRDDVFHMKWNRGEEVGQTAILTLPVSTLTNSSLSCCIHRSHLLG